MVVGTMARGFQVAVLGGGPGGYVAAIRLAQLGKDVVLIEENARLGGVCVREGCIPSKALIHAADLAWEAQNAAAMGITVQGLTVEQPKLIRWKDGIVRRLTGGVKQLCDSHGVEVLHGRGELEGDRSLLVTGEEGQVRVELEQLVLATGSSSLPLPGFEVDGEAVIGPREALDLGRVPERLVVIGGGYIGLELGSVFAKLGSKVAAVEMLPSLLPGLDPEVGQLLERRLKKLGVELYLGHRADSVARGEPSVVTASGPDGTLVRLDADVVLVAVGRQPSSAGIGLERVGVELDEQGFVRVDEKMQTSVPGIYAIGDLAGGALLAHKAYQEAKVVADVIAGRPAAFDSVVPAVVYTDPEVAWVGLSEQEARAQGHKVRTGSFRLRASGRALTLDAPDGFVKAVADEESRQLLGVVAVGRGVSELVGEATLALEMGAFLEDVGLTIHPHPTMSEALQEAVEAALSMSVHLPRGERRAASSEQEG